MNELHKKNDACLMAPVKIESLLDKIAAEDKTRPPIFNDKFKRLHNNICSSTAKRVITRCKLNFKMWPFDLRD